MDLARAASRFDPARKQTFTFPTGLNGSLPDPTVLYYGGLEAGGGKPQVGDIKTGACHHRGSLYATGTTSALAEAGAQGPEVWDPAPGWGKKGAVLRRPRCLLIIPQLRYAAGILQADDCRERIPALADALKPFGVAVCLSANPLHNMRPLAAACPTLSLASHRQPFTSPLDIPIVKLDPAYFDATDVTGGDVMVVELNAARWMYGGIPGIGHPEFDAGYTFKFLDANYQTNPPPSLDGGTRYEFQTNPFFEFSPVDGHPVYLWEVLGKPFVLSYPPDAKKDGLAAAALAARCRSYRHQVYQLDQWGPTSGDPDFASGPMDDAGLFAELYGGLDFARRAVVPVDAAAVWARVRADALAFFSA